MNEIRKKRQQVLSFLKIDEQGLACVWCLSIFKNVSPMAIE